MIARIQSQLFDEVHPNRNEKVIAVLPKSLYLYLIFKIAFIWPLLHDIVTYTPTQIGSGIRYLAFFPLAIAGSQVQLFLIVFALLLLLSLFIKTNYICGFFVFWFSLSFTKLIASVGNGSDLVLNIFLFICIFLSITPRFSSEKKFEYQVLISNAALLLGQIQLSLIYFLSGYDKLTSIAWQTGAAMHSITNLTFFQNPFLRLELSQQQSAALCWLIISFELGFSILIWFKKFRVPLLALGVLFHLGIVFFLGLADFGIIMILCYAVFLPFTRTETLRHEASLQS